MSGEGSGGHPTQLLKIAVVGAGISGLTAARTLADHGHRVRAFDKARGAGGRLSTRRAEGSSFDHGAQYFTVRDERFERHAASWIQQGVAAPWQARIVRLEDGKHRNLEGSVERFVGVPGMSALTRHLAKSVDVAPKTRVERVEREGRRWRLFADGGGDLGDYDVVLITTPPAQAVPLLAAAPSLAERAAAVEMLPCWAVMATFPQPLALPFDAAFVHGSPLSWIARNDSKPGRGTSEGGESWVLHASREWSLGHLEDDAATVSTRLLEALAQAIRLSVEEPRLLQAHRWRYSIPDDPLSEGCLWQRELNIGACGDWCAGGRVEGAFLSGLALAGRILG